MALERRQPLGLGRRFAGFEIVLQRAFGVDDQLAFAGQVDDRIGPPAAGFPGHMGLQGEVDARPQPGHFQRVEQLLFAPAARGLAARPQRRHQLRGFVADLALPEHHRGDLFLQPAIGLRPRRLDLLQLAFIAHQRFSDGREQRFDRGFRQRLVLGEPGVGAFEELRLRRLQGLAGDGLEGLVDARQLGLVRAVAFVLRRADGAQFARQPFAFGFGPGEFLVAPGQHHHFGGVAPALLALAADFGSGLLGGLAGFVPLGAQPRQRPRPQRPAEQQGDGQTGSGGEEKFGQDGPFRRNMWRTLGRAASRREGGLWR